MFALLTLKNYPLPSGEGLARFSLPDWERAGAGSDKGSILHHEIKY